MSYIVCGWKGYSTDQENLFDGVIDKIVQRSSIPILVTRFPLPIEHTSRIFLAFTSQQAKSRSFVQRIILATTLATELKASLQLLQVIPSRGVDIDLSERILPADTPVQKVRGNFVTEVSRLLKPNDLLVLNGSVSQKGQIFSLLGHVPEVIAHIHPKLAIIIAYLPQ